MRLWLELAAPWTARSPEREDEAQVFVHPELAVRLHTTQLYARLADDPETYRAVARARVPGDYTIEPVGAVASVSALGWPVHIHEQRVASPDRKTVDHQLHVFYRVLEMGGTVVVAGPPASIVAHRDDLLTAALAARPDWTGEIACVADLFAGVAFTPAAPRPG